MKLGLDISVDLVAVMAAEIKAGERAVTAAMRDAGTDLKAAWRGQIAQAGLGRRLANSIRSQSYPRAGESLRAAALVWSKAPVIIGGHDTGPLIRSRDGFWLAIPLLVAASPVRQDGVRYVMPALLAIAMIAASGVTWLASKIRLVLVVLADS